MAGTGVLNQPTVKPDSFSNRSLWQLINGTGVLRPKELVSRELTRNGKKILEGLSFYKKPVHIAGEQLKGKKMSKLHKAVVQKISQFLGVEELQSWELFSSFLSNDYRGSQKNLQLILNNERHTQALVYKIRDYFYTERLYLLLCVKVVINFWQDEDHPYKDELEQFIRRMTADGNIMEKLLDQLKACIKEALPTWETNGTMMTERQAHVWAHQNLLEQCELLEILVIFLKDLEMDTDQAISLIEMFKRHGFGRHQKYKHILEDSAEPFIRRIGHLEMLILLESLDLEMVHGCTHLGSFDGHCILKDPSSFKRLDEVMQTLGSDPCHAPLLLSWAAIRMVYPTETDIALTRKMGNSALALRVFDVLYDILSSEPFTNKTSFVSSVAHYIVYNMLVNLLSTFDEGSLGGERETKVLYASICKLLKQEFVAEDFWNKLINDILQEDTSVTETTCPEATPMDVDEYDLVPTVLQTPTVRTRTCSTQLSLLTPNKRSRRTQTMPRIKDNGCQTEKPKMRSMEVQCNILKPDKEICPADVSHHDLDQSWTSSDHRDDTEDLDYMPSEPDSDGDDDFDEESRTDGERLFLVSESSLLDLFHVCPRCCSPSLGHVSFIFGTLVKVEQDCGLCGHYRTWNSQYKYPSREYQVIL